METKLLLLADAANVSREGKLNILGEFNVIWSSQLPVGWPYMVVVARLESSPVEGLDHAAQLRIADDDGHEVFRTPLMPVEFSRQGEGLPIRANLVFALVGAVFPKYGTYEFHLFVDGHRLALPAPLYVRRPPQEEQGPHGPRPEP